MRYVVVKLAVALRKHILLVPRPDGIQLLVMVNVTLLVMTRRVKQECLAEGAGRPNQGTQTAVMYVHCTSAMKYLMDAHQSIQFHVAMVFLYI